MNFRAFYGKQFLSMMLFVLSATGAVADSSTSSDFAAFPPSNSEASSPLVMLVMSHDHQLYLKAYNDFSDLDGDGVIDTTYTDTFDYYGYYHSNYCYAYSSTSDTFKPIKAATGANKHHCTDSSSTAGGAPWSGNFLNWATMTRMDIIRRVLFGGKRKDDPANPAAGNVVLERVILPPDVHSFSKVFAGADLVNYTPYSYNASSLPAITLCNTTPGPVGSGVLLQNVNTVSNPPKIRVAEGAWQDWAASEIEQCTWGGSFRPNQNLELGTFNAHIESCLPNLDGDDEARCRQYSNGNLKPYGLLQEYGENNRLRFGLMTGSTSRTRHGGVLRKNIGKVVGNTDAKLDEINLATGQFINQQPTGGAASIEPSVINTLSRLRISRYRYSLTQGNKAPFYEDCASAGISTSSFDTHGSDTSSVACRDWGNPLSELYAEALRYFSGQTAPYSQFGADDSGHIDFLGPVGWIDSQPSGDDCSQCAIIVLSTGLTSFDGMAATISNAAGAEDGLPTDITGLTYSKLQSNMLKIATLEGINGNYFIGDVNLAKNHAEYGKCSAKQITPATFVDARGLCPEGPNIRGSYHIAGLTYHAQGQDLRGDRDGAQSVRTWAVQLAESLPRFEIPVGTGKVRFVPYCRAENAGTERQCALINVEVIEDFANNTGEVYITWEDSSWGSDYDLDGKQQIKFCVGPVACQDASMTINQIKFTTDVVRVKAGHILRFGYIIAGTTADATYADEVTAGKHVQPDYLSDAPAPVSRTFTAGVTDVKYLENPLWFAAKYGAFNDMDGDGTPLHNGDPSNKVEWDIKNTSGEIVAGGDGLPDNYYPIKNPARLEDRMRAILQSLTSAVQSNTSAAVIATTGRGIGAIYQAVYYPQFKTEDAFGNTTGTINWAGALNAFFIDDRGRLREDLGVKYKLENSAVDYPISIYFDEDQNQTLVQRYDDNDNAVGSPFALRDVGTLWSVQQELAELSEAQVKSQRDYTTDAGTGRHIFTWVDYDLDGVVDQPEAGNSEVIDFTEANFSTTASGIAGENYRWLGLDGTNSALSTYLVNYIRGVEYADGDIVIDGNPVPARSRKIDMDGDLADEIWRLGDIIHSSPAVVAAPNNPEITDSDYKLFKEHYANRRQVVYIGTNDGMLHAINGGFFNAVNLEFVGGGDVDGDGVSEYSEHKVGAELWAYVPGNLLPHLRWLPEPDYPHVYYVDGSINSYDVRIFDKDDADHPGGWGTILVVGMRLGGGAITMDVMKDANGDGTANNEQSHTTGSAYVILDVTNPEAPPQLIAELSPENVGYTVGSPTVIRRNSGSGDWVLLFGSGPNVLQSVTSTQHSTLYAYDLVAREMLAVNSDLADDLSEPNSAFGSFTAVDWTNSVGDSGADGTHDAVFVGTVSGSAAIPTGVLKKIELLGDRPNLGIPEVIALPLDDLLAVEASGFTAADVERPISAAPIATLDTEDAEAVGRWISFGTGRFEVVEDMSSNAEQAYYGILDPDNDAYIDSSDEGIVDVTEVLVLPNAINNIKNRDGSDVQYTRNSTTSTFYKYSELREFIRDQRGWFRRFDSGKAGYGAERNITDSTHFGQTLLFTTYMPETNTCEIGGLGFLYAINAFTGLPGSPTGTLGTGVNNGVNYELSRVGLGNTLPSRPIVHHSASGGSKAIVQGSRGEFMLTDLTGASKLTGRQSWREVKGIEFLLTE